MNKLVEIVIPAHNEEYNIPVIYSAISAALAETNYSFKVLFVDDGSTDGTLHSIQDLSSHHDNVFYISLSRNFGHQNALKAGLDASSADIVVMMDADMQHPPSLIPSLLKAHEEGFDVVYTVRKDNEHISFVKKHTAKMFYSLMNYLSEIEIEPGSADFRLMNRKTLDALLLMPDQEIFYRGLVKWIGFKQTKIEYEPQARHTGVTKYSTKKMLRFAITGIATFSNKPLYFAAYMGFTFAILSVLYIPYIIYAFYSGTEVHGWASIVATLAFFGGIILMMLGIVGIYLGKLFEQSKNRPQYLVKAAKL
jgi:glycosyltransferase involved in cell wall biosynthesis